MESLDNYRAKIEERPSLWFAWLCALFAYPVIAADILHRDDLWRISSGLYAWAQHGRPMADFATQILTLGGPNVTNVAPFSQIVFALCLLLAFAVTSTFLRREYGSPFALPPAVLFLNPFFLGNILYQYDSLGMGLAIALTAVAFVMVSRFEPLRFAYSVVIMAVVLALYQPILNLFIGLTALQISVITSRGPDLRAMLHALALRASQFVAGYVCYYIVIGLPLGSVSTRSETVSLNGEGFASVVETVGRFILFAWQFMQSKSPVFSVLMYSFVILGVVSFAVVIARSSRKLVTSLGILFALVISILSFFGPLMLIEDMPVVYRTVPSSAAPLAVLAVFLCTSRVFWPVVAAPLFVSVLLSFQTMAAYKSQRAFDAFVARQVASDLNSEQATDAAIFTFGAVPVAPHAMLAHQLHPMIRDLTEPAKHWIFESLLIQHGLTNTVALWSNQRPAVEKRFSEISCAEMRVLRTTDYYQILQVDGTIFVIMPDAAFAPCVTVP